MTDPDHGRQSVSGAPVRSIGELAPQHDYDRTLVKGANPFARFRDLDDDAWLELLLRSMEERVIDGVEFPGFPQPELQSLIHGSSGETGIGGRSVWLDLDNDGFKDTNEASAITSSTGYYVFKNLAAGNYVVRQVLASGWKQTSPASGLARTFTLASGETKTAINFCTTPI